MSNLNVVTMIGNVGTEPEQREFESGAKVTKFSIGVSRWNKKDQKDVKDWFDVETTEIISKDITFWLIR